MTTGRIYTLRRRRVSYDALCMITVYASSEQDARRFAREHAEAFVRADWNRRYEFEESVPPLRACDIADFDTWIDPERSYCIVEDLAEGVIASAIHHG